MIPSLKGYRVISPLNLQQQLFVNSTTNKDQNKLALELSIDPFSTTLQIQLFMNQTNPFLRACATMTRNIEMLAIAVKIHTCK